MGDSLYAFTDGLRGDQFDAYIHHMQGLIDFFEDAVTDCLPVVNSVRDRSDDIFLRSTTENVEQVRKILLGFRDLSHGDANQVAILGRLLDNVEDYNANIAARPGKSFR